MFDKDHLKELFEKFNSKKILIIGDVMIDAYIWGKVERISPEAPVPIVAVNKRESRLGGAANVALNIKTLGAEPVLCSVIGDDQKGHDFIDLIRAEGMTDQGLHKSNNRITTTKFRVIGNNSQLLRVDEEVTTALSGNEETALIDRIKSILNKGMIDAIIFQDYNKGILTENVISSITGIAQDFNIPTVCDPKKLNFDRFKNLTLFKPNLKELKEGLNIDTDLSNKEELEKAAKQLQQKQQIGMVLITLSEKGVFISYTENNINHYSIIPAHRRSIADVSGAGDTVVSVAALCIASNTDAVSMAKLSNLAGGIVC